MLAATSGVTVTREWWEVVMELYVRVIASDLGLPRSAAQAAGLH